ncbi:MAG: sarcosine oxidase gamma subunit [Gammaproteobacteria bacterium]|nr:sarcosine oxidase gamma subunit [Gammaproteobacteria bacterium]
MNESELLIARLSPRNTSLLQIHGGDIREASPLAARVLGDPDPALSSICGPRAYVIGPTEWLLIDYSVDDVRRQMSRDLGRILVRVTDLSAAFASLRVEGAAARTVLASDIGAPWMAATARPGQYARTRLGQIEVVVHCVGTDAFELHVDRSVVDHLEAWLLAQYEAQSPSKQSLVQ